MSDSSSSIDMLGELSVLQEEEHEAVLEDELSGEEQDLLRPIVPEVLNSLGLVA